MNYFDAYNKTSNREAVGVSIAFFVIILLPVIFAPQTFCLVALYFIIVANEKRLRYRERLTQQQ